MSYFYTNEIVFRGHPDKLCDQISDALLDAYMEQDCDSRCGIETMGGKGKIFITGEVTSEAEVDVEYVVKSVLKEVGYSKDYEIINNIGQQSPDIAQGIDIGGAGDQGMMFGYACRDTENGIPLAMHILQCLAMFYDTLRRSDKRFLPDGKAQITGCYDDKGKLIYIKDFVVSYQNTEIDREDTDRIIKERCLKICHENDIAVEQFYFNPTGKFLIGGFEGDSGLTGRKICVDNYHSFVPIGGGAFSGKDPTKVDRSAAYKARQTALECLNEHPEVNNVLVQLSYAIGLSKPMAIYIKTDKGIIEPWEDLYRECEPNNIIEDLNLKNIDYRYTAQFGHFGVHGWYPKEIYKKYLPWEDEVKVIND